MRMVRTDWVRDGMRLAREVPNPNPAAAPLLREGARLSERMAASLRDRRIRAVWIEDELSAGIVPVSVVPEEVRRCSEQAAASCLDEARGVLARGHALGPAALAEVERAAAAIADALAECPEAVLCFDDLTSADSYSHSHCVRVAALGMLLGERIMRVEGWVNWQGKLCYDRIDERLAVLGLGLLLHDIGKVSIPSEILNKPTELTESEDALIRTHPQAGASILPASVVDARAVAVVRSHHEQFDGQGYPSGRAGPAIHQFARVAAVANAYDALTASRPYRDAVPPHVAWRYVRDNAGTIFDPAVVRHFSELVMPYPVGSAVALPDGSDGVVASTTAGDPECPLVRYREPSGALAQARVRLVNGVAREVLPDETKPAPDDTEEPGAGAGT
jgi:HD-GYP domain-containing protein (c-di-GMP phosphodiesterase class II)